MRRTVTVAQRRARLAERHGLAPWARAADVVDAAERMVGLHATDPASVYVAAWARVPGITVDDVERALYEERTLLRHLCMRRTLFVLPRHLVEVAQRAASDGVAATMRQRTGAELVRGGIAAHPDAWIDDVLAEVREAIAANGPQTGSQLAAAVPRLRTVVAAPIEVTLTTRLLTLAAAEGRLVRDRPIGPWTSSRHRWALADLPSGAEPLSCEDATAILVQRWLRAYGPAPLADLVWWSGLGVTRVKRALAALSIAEVDLVDETGATTTGLALADDLDDLVDGSGLHGGRSGRGEPWVALLPSLDSTPMGWKQRDWFLGPHAPQLFDRTGNIGPSAWVDGRIVGGWATTRGGEVVVRTLEDCGREARARLDEVAAALTAWLDGRPISPRFPTPIDVELRGEPRSSDREEARG